MTSSNYRRVAFEIHGRECAWCEGKERVEVHHRDGDRNNNEPDNLLPLCHDCHVKLHTDGLGGLESELLPVAERSHIVDGVLRYTLDCPDELWEEWKETVPRRMNLNDGLLKCLAQTTLEERGGDLDEQTRETIQAILDR